MGRHRPMLRELGWGVSNSPNPWKHGSAKRVVRTLDYSQAEIDEPASEPVTEVLPAAAPLGDKLERLQQDGREQLDRIREQFEAQEAESKRKLDRLNGRIAELGEGKRAMWSVLGQYQAHKQQTKDGKAPSAAGGEAAAAPSDDAAAADAAAAASEEGMAAPSADAAALERREAALGEKVAAAQQLAQDAAAQAEAAAQREAAVSAREEAVGAREARAKERDAALAKQAEQLAAREEELHRRAAAVAAREKALAAKEDALETARGAAGKQQAAGADATTSTAAGAAAATSSTVLGKAGAAAAKADAKQPAASGKAAAGGAKAAEASSAAAAGGKGKGKGPEVEIVCDSTAEWLRSENLTASLVRQRYENPDEVFFPLPSQRTCELTEIFSAPRRRERAKGSGEWTPVDCAEASAAHAAQERAALAAQAAAKESVPPNALVLMGVEGEYMGEVMGLSVVAGAGAPAKTILLGRSSSCDVTLGRDDQVSRRHMQIEARDGKLFARDLGSTYGTKLNGKPLGGEAAELKVGDLLVLGASSFQLKTAAAAK